MRKLYSLLLCLPLAFVMSCNNQENATDGSNNDTADLQTAEAQPNDKQISYYDNGQAQFMQQYLNGIKHGEYKDWFKNGQLRTMGYYDMGMRDGTWKWYGEKGEITLQVRYDKQVAELY
ncbi:MAG: hypothetical protein HY951_05790 [Bacteroidia bacterium]|nr:hypothetical protein [Bacteroidia bacterium]